MDKEIEAFAENLRRLTPAEDPVMWNLNRGLQEIAARQAELHRELLHIREFLETAPLR